MYLRSSKPLGSIKQCLASVLLGVAVGFQGLSPQVLANPKEGLNIVTSIKPLQLMVASITANTDAKVKVLLPTNASVHQYALKPSDRLVIQQADWILWVGPSLETFLAKVLTDAAGRQQALMPESSDQDRHEDHDHHESARDPHLWLGPDAMRSALVNIAATLSERDPKNKQVYQVNLKQSLQALDQQLALSKEQLSRAQAKAKAKGFIAFHPAYDRWVQYFGLRQLEVVSLHPGQSPGAKHLAKLNQLIRDDQVSCILIEPQYDARRVRALIEQQPIPIISIDPLAGDIEAGVSGLIQFYQRLTSRFQQCLTGDAN
jgi:zinc transport system substrate-binding protein